ncbi:MAG: phage holin family protein [Bacteroidota bacterium]
MNYIIRLLLTAVAVWLGATYIQGVSVDAYGTAIIVALVLGLLNTFVKPVLKLLSFPITILTLGLFLLVINVVIIYMADYFIEGFAVSGFIAPLIFSFVISIASSILNLIFD